MSTTYQYGGKVCKTFEGFKRHLLKGNPVAKDVIETPEGRFMWICSKAQLLIYGAHKITQ